MRPGVPEGQTGADDEITDGARYEHLASAGDRGDPSANVDGESRDGVTG